jgi:hypothetical protein
MRKHKRLMVLALIVSLAVMLAAAGLVNAAGARGRVLWQEKCPVWGGEVIVTQEGGLTGVYVVQCFIGD